MKPHLALDKSAAEEKALFGQVAPEADSFPPAADTEQSRRERTACSEALTTA